MNATTTRRIRVFLLDDHEIVRGGLRRLLEKEADLDVVGEAGTVEEAVRLAPDARPDVAVVDYRLPDGNGIAFARELRRLLPGTRCLVLTSYDDEDAVIEALDAGVAGFLLKQIRGNDFVDAVRRVAAGQSLLDPVVTRTVLRRMREGERPDALARLTEQEKRVLGLIGEGMTNRQIAERMGLSEKTVKNYVTRLLSKLELTSRTQAALLSSKLETS